MKKSWWIHLWETPRDEIPMLTLMQCSTDSMIQSLTYSREPWIDLSEGNLEPAVIKDLKETRL